MKYTKILISSLLILLPLVHARVLESLGIPFGFILSGNFEFTKSVFFTIFSCLIFLVFFGEKFFEEKKRISRIHGKNTFLFFVSFLVLFLSLLFSKDFSISLFADNEKGHTFLVFFLLWGWIYMLSFFEKKELERFFFFTFVGSLFPCFLAWKEYFFPHFPYGELASRALGSFGHPNYLAGYLLGIIPIFFLQKKNFWSIGVLTILCCTLAMTGSVVAISALFFAGLFLFLQKYFPATKRGKILLFSLGLGIFILGIFCIFFFFPSKLHSFVSRFYIWETSLKIIFSHVQSIFFGIGFENLPKDFMNQKNLYLYIFENFGFTADRAHNIFLDIFLASGIFGLGVFIAILWEIQKKLFSSPKKSLPACLAVFFFLFFGFFHYFSIASFLLVIFWLVYILGEKPSQKTFFSQKISIILGICIVCGSLFSAEIAFRLFFAEIFAYTGDISRAKNCIETPFYDEMLGAFEKAEKIRGYISAQSYKIQISRAHGETLQNLCENFTREYSAAEYFYFCAQKLEFDAQFKLAYNYYAQSAKNLPDLWKADSPYWKNFIVEKSITGNRFFSEKYAPTREILQKLDITVESR